jgi:hypothetical protein
VAEPLTVAIGVASVFPSSGGCSRSCRWLYVLPFRLFELGVLLVRRERSKELEILVLRHELSILRRQVKGPQFAPRDRLLLAALSRVLPRRSWHVFLVTPETLLRWHRVGCTYSISLQIERIRYAAEFCAPHAPIATAAPRAHQIRGFSRRTVGSHALLSAPRDTPR